MNFVNNYMYFNNSVSIYGPDVFFNNVRTGKNRYVNAFLNSYPYIKNRACSYLKIYGKGREQEAIADFLRGEFISFLSPLFGIVNLPNDVKNILIGELLIECGYKKIGDTYEIIGFLGIIGVVIFASVLISKFAK